MLKDVLEDDSFKTSSSVVKNARQMAASLLEWCEKVENKANISEFMKYVTEKLNGAVQSSSTKRFSKEKIWQRYFTLRSSDEFIQQWKSFLFQAELPATPVLFQHLTDLLFRLLVKETYQVNKNHNSDEDFSMMNDEKNVLQYVAGCVCRHLRKKIERSGHPFKELEDSDVHEELLTKIIELYVTIRCYAFATVSMEKFKQNHKKSTQHSKPLRTVVQGESN